MSVRSIQIFSAKLVTFEKILSLFRLKRPLWFWTPVAPKRDMKFYGHYFLAHCASFMSKWTLLSGWVCISLVVTGPITLHIIICNSVQYIGTVYVSQDINNLAYHFLNMGDHIPDYFPRDWCPRTSCHRGQSMPPPTPLENLRTSHHYCIEGLKGSHQLGPHFTERL